MAQFGSALALGARCRRFESCLPDSLKSQSRTDIFAASPGRLFYCSQTLLRKTCVKPREPQSVCVRRFWTSPDSWTPAGNDSATDSAQAFVTRLSTNVIHQINTCLLAPPQRPKVTVLEVYLGKEIRCRRTRAPGGINVDAAHRKACIYPNLATFAGANHGTTWL